MFLKTVVQREQMLYKIDANKTHNEFARRCVFSYHPISIVKSIFYQIKIQIIMTGQTIKSNINKNVFVVWFYATWDTLLHK